MENIRMGIVGPGRIVRRVMKDFHKAKGIELVAVASRSLERAQEAAKEYGAKYAFGSYEELAKCGEIDLVYIATPHNFHCGQAVLMMEHGKHIICEKPITISEAETRTMVECARKNGVFLMEAMWTRFFPAMQRMRKLIEDGAIGEVKHIYGVFSSSVETPDPTDRVFDPGLAGGAMLDIGVYPLMAVTSLLGWKPEKVQGLYRIAETGVDAAMSVQMQFAGGATAQIMTALDTFAPSPLRVYGTKGCIAMDDFWHSSAFTLVRKGGEKAEYTFAPENEGFYHEFDEVVRCIREGLIESPTMTHEESIAVSRIMEDLRHEAGVYYPGEKAE